jgi:hypothetical protein
MTDWSLFYLQATMFGIENDLHASGETADFGDRRMKFKRQRPAPPPVNQDWDDSDPSSGINSESNQTSNNDTNAYHAMTHTQMVL